MFKKTFLARLFRLLGAAIVLSAGYFVYMDTQLTYVSSEIIGYETNHPIIRFSTSASEQITYKLTNELSVVKHPIGSNLEIRYPVNQLYQLEYVSPLLGWLFYIVLFIGLIVFFVGAILTIQLRKTSKK